MCSPVLRNVTSVLTYTVCKDNLAWWEESVINLAHLLLVTSWSLDGHRRILSVLAISVTSPVNTAGQQRDMIVFMLHENSSWEEASVPSVTSLVSETNYPTSW